MSDYLIHYGVKGMKWGVRKQQPSSVRSSVLAGLYAATGNERVGRSLDKSNDRDAKKWEKAKAERKESNNGMSTKKKVAIAATVIGAAAVGTGLAIYGKKQYGSLNPRKIAAGRELANRISGRSNEVALKSIKKSYKYTPIGIRNGRVSRVNNSPRSLEVYNKATNARLFRGSYERTGDPYYLDMMRFYGNDYGKTPLIPPKKSKIRRR